MDKLRALEILGLGGDAGPKQIDDKFANLHRRIKNGEDLDADAINRAYDFLTGRERYEEKKGAFSRFLRKFTFTYKGWIILIFISLAIIAVVTLPIAFKRIPDLSVSFAGRFGFSDEEFMDDVLQEAMPDVEDILVEVMYLDESGESGEYDMGGRTRLSALLMTEEADLLIVDDITFNFIREDNSLMALDEVLESLSVEIPPERYVNGIDFDTGEKMVFGISVEGNYLVEESIYGSDRRILCIAKKTAHLEDVKRAIEIILTYGSENDG